MGEWNHDDCDDLKEQSQHAMAMSRTIACILWVKEREIGSWIMRSLEQYWNTIPKRSFVPHHIAGLIISCTYTV